MDNEQRLLWRTGRVARALGVSAQRVRTLVAEGRLQVTRTADGALLFDPSAVESFVRGREQARILRAGGHAEQDAKR